MPKSVFQGFVQESTGDIVVSPAIEVRKESDGLLATIYSDSAGTSESNPFTGTAEGLAKFYADGGLYKITATGGAAPVVLRDVPIGEAAAYDVGSSDTDLIPVLDADQRYSSEIVADIGGTAGDNNYDNLLDAINAANVIIDASPGGVSQQVVKVKTVNHTGVAITEDLGDVNANRITFVGVYDTAHSGYPEFALTGTSHFIGDTVSATPNVFASINIKDININHNATNDLIDAATGWVVDVTSTLGSLDFKSQNTGEVLKSVGSANVMNTFGGVIIENGAINAATSSGLSISLDDISGIINTTAIIGAGSVAVYASKLGAFTEQTSFTGAYLIKTRSQAIISESSSFTVRGDHSLLGVESTGSSNTITFDHTANANMADGETVNIYGNTSSGNISTSAINGATIVSLGSLTSIAGKGKAEMTRIGTNYHLSGDLV